MKRILCFFVLFNLLGVLSALCAEGTTIKNWQSVEIYDVATLKGNVDAQIRRVVGVRCNFRGKDIRHPKPNWYESSIWQPNPNGKGFADVRVMVAKQDLAAFKSITTNAQSAGVITVYGEVLRDSESKIFFIRLLGRKSVVDPNGNATVRW
jgi:hypothetical protein